MLWQRDNQVGLLVFLPSFLLSFFQPLSVVDWPSFRSLLKFQRPSTKEADIPHRTTVTQTILATAECVKEAADQEAVSGAQLSSR